MDRRQFLKTLAAATALSGTWTAGAGRALAQAGALAPGVPVQGVAPISPKGRLLVRLFDYEGVRLRPSRWLRQFEAARAFYLSIPDDDILKGFREIAGLPAPGKHLGGWAARSSAGVFGQWLQALARGYHATGDAELRDKAVRLAEGYARTVGADGDPRMSSRSMANSTYSYEKLVGGLIDLDRYMNWRDGRYLLDRIINWGIANLDRARRAPRNRGLGYPTEWYTMPENLYRAYQWMGDDKYREFAEVWHYPSYWDRFIESSRPENIAGLHAYSHVNTLSSAAKAYEITGDEKYLVIAKNAYEWLQRDQCYATGGYGPDEFMMAPDGALGRSLESSVESFETPCGSWAGFKLCAYLMQFTGDARYGDWIEKLLYNGIGAALDMGEGGRTFYYSNYNLAGGRKDYYADAYPCCAGTFFQDVVEYHNLIYLRDAQALYVNLYLPSEVVWLRGDDTVRFEIATEYPEQETIECRVSPSRELAFPIKFRVPAWARGVTVAVNGEAAPIEARPGSWATLERTWREGDSIRLRIPLRWSAPPVDPQHPRRVALLRGPVAMAQDAARDPAPIIPPEDQLEGWLSPGEASGEFVAAGGARFRPLYGFERGQPYRVYFDPEFRPVPIETGRG